MSTVTRGAGRSLYFEHLPDQFVPGDLSRIHGGANPVVDPRTVYDRIV